MKALVCFFLDHAWHQTSLRTEGVFVIQAVHCRRCGKRLV